MTDHAPERVVLVLQGGGALGAYQAGAYEALCDAGIHPDWVAGISIGAINAAIIAGNAPENRIPRLKSFWEEVSSSIQVSPFMPGEYARTFFNEISAVTGASFGVPGFFEPRYPSPLVAPPGSPGALSFYDTAPLLATLHQLVDFGYLANSTIRLSVGAVNIRTGNFAYFDSKDQALAPEHVMASGALPPGFPPIVIEGEAYWDGGLVSNTPLQYVLDNGGPRDDMVIFQVDLFSARGPMPRTIAEVTERDKDIRYSSRTRLNTDVFRKLQTLRRAAARLVSKLPSQFEDDDDALLLRGSACDSAVTIVHLIHRQAAYETETKDYEFSRLSVEEHWEAGRDDVRRTLRHKAWRERKRPDQGVAVLDLTEPGHT